MSAPSRSALIRLTLANGLRVVLAPDHSAPVVGLAVVYDVGTRSEPVGRSGFAHLFEHLMFQGSPDLGKLPHSRYIQASGGRANGSTRLDYTSYVQALPSNALERALFLEADRMRALRLTEPNLRNQVEVIKEEMRSNVASRPYGGFPWLTLPPVVFDHYANAHDGYGSLVDLESATVADAIDFFERYYAAANAVLCVAGDFHPDQVIRMVERHFGDVPGRPAPPMAHFAEPDLVGERRCVYADPLAPLPAFAAAWRVPDPIRDFAGFLPAVVLASLLAGGRASRLANRLVLARRCVTKVEAYVSVRGEPFAVRDPTVLIIQAYLPKNAAVDPVLDAIADECDRLAQDPLPVGELAWTVARMTVRLLKDSDWVLNRALVYAVFEQQQGDAALADALPDLLAQVTEEEVREAAARLVPSRRAVLEVIPGRPS